MNILEKIIEHKKQEVGERKKRISIKQLEQNRYFFSQPFSFKKSIQDKDRFGIIAEFKRKSPSKGVINDVADVAQVTTGYVQAGASALSILTDATFFGGCHEDLVTARKLNQCPILRKDFIIDEYQIVEAKSIGADAILLIAAILKPEQIKYLSDFAHSFGLEVLLEVHSFKELYPEVFSSVDLIGVNNRNLKTFEVDINLSKKLLPFIPDNIVKISESGISQPETIIDLRKQGYEGFLMGENFMKHNRPELAAADFILTLKALA
ncbi:MAG: indole-3-glycerol phosphate synthase TrpC [Bacteroidetes bacterium]|nr:indole-3-glycerol phosphate synthase TrpC [Bacteroidota bacterium]